jgi:ABC-type transport system involved in multi-copper enzyme maturation permease subunit
MIVWPVITRELRASARQPFTYYLRLLGVAAMLFACMLFLLEYDALGHNVGGKLFGRLHFTLFWAVWILVPLLAADCLSRERREGTLGLLFLTQLKANDIVMAKGLAHGLRALTLGLSVLPVVTIPFLLGGVSWTEAVMSVVMNLGAICLALAAGVLASAWSRAWLRALLHAAVLAICLLLAWGLVTGWLLSATIKPLGWARTQFSADDVLLNGLGFITNASQDWPNYLRLVSPSQWVLAMGEILLISLLALCGAILVAGKKTERSWREEPPPLWMQRWQQVFFTPFLLLSFFHRWMRRKLERNPIGWLEQRTWSGRLVVWGWFAALISVYSAVLTDRYFFRGSNSIQALMAWMLAGSIAMGAAGSFRRERQTGVLELLLVCPLGEAQIIAGRLRGIWGQFLPAVSLLLGLWLYFASFLPGSGPGMAIAFYATSFATLPVVGLYFSLRCRNFISAFLATLAVGLLVPLLFSSILGWLWLQWVDSSGYSGWGFRPSGPAAVCQLGFAALCWRQLHRSLKRRAFPLERIES